MLGTIIKKEILEALLSLRFLIATLLCLVLIPLGIFANLKEYEQRLRDYQDAERLYEQRAKGNIDEAFRAEGYRPPSVLSVFSVGLEYYLPNKAVTSHSGTLQVSNEQGISNPQSLLFGKVDLLFNVSFVISLLALLFTFNAVTGEKEEGTLRLAMSNPVPHWTVLLGKMIGNYAVLLVPLIISLIISLIVMQSFSIVSVFSAEIFPAFLTILIVTMLFVLCMLNVGLLVSTLTHRSITSIVTLLFVWTILVLSLPKISPMIAGVISPVKSQQVLDQQELLIRQNLNKELDRKKRELYDRLQSASGVKTSAVPAQNEAERVLQARYDEAKKPLDLEYLSRIGDQIRALEQEFDNKRAAQQSLATNLSRLSPVSCYAYILSEVSGTGILELSSFLNQARRFQEIVQQDIYDKYISKSYGGTNGMTATMTSWADNFDPAKASVPRLLYRQPALSEGLKAELPDIALLILFNLLFFASGFASFIRYDLR